MEAVNDSHFESSALRPDEACDLAQTEEETEGAEGRQQDTEGRVPFGVCDGAEEKPQGDEQGACAE